MGTVWRALDLRTQRQVALKSLHVGGVDANRRLRLEIQALAPLRHPNLVAVLDAGTDEKGTPYLVMELVTGTTLRDELTRIGKLPIDRVCVIGQQVARGLAAAHAERVVHRDLKPSNIMLSDLYGESDTVKVVDFGIAQSLDHHRTSLSGSPFVGTPQYASPEQAMGEAATPSSDLYSFGVLLYEALTGAHLFRADSAMGVLFHHVYSPPSRPSSLASDVPAWLDQLVWSLVQKEPSARPQSAREVAASLAERRFEIAVGAHAPKAGSPEAPPPTPVTGSVSHHEARTRSESFALNDTEVQEHAMLANRSPVLPAADTTRLAPQTRRRRFWGLMAVVVVSFSVIPLLTLFRPTSGDAASGRPSTPGPVSPPVTLAQEALPPSLEQVTRIRNEAVTFSALSPSGRHLVYGEASGAALLDVDTGAKRVFPFYGAGRIKCADWYPDDRYLLVTSEDPERHTDVVTIDSESGAYSRHNVDAQCPILSPDGRRIAFRRSNTVIVQDFPNIYAPDDRDATPRVLRSAGEDGGLAWSPDGQWIATYEDRDIAGTLAGEIVAQHIDSGETRVLLRDIPLRQRGELAAVAWLSNWELLFFRARDSTGGLWSLTIEPESVMPRTPPTHLIDVEASMAAKISSSRTGKRIAVELGTISESVLTTALDTRGQSGSKPQPLTPPMQAILQGWLDDERLILSSDNYLEPGLMLESLQSRVRQPFLSATIKSPSVITNHRVAFFRAHAAGTTRHDELWVTNSSGNDDRLVHAFTDDGNAAALTHVPPLLSCGRLTTDCLCAPPSNSRAAMLVDVETGKKVGSFAWGSLRPHQLALSSDATLVASLSPVDGRRIAFSDRKGRLLWSARLPKGCQAEQLAFGSSASGVYVTGTCLGDVSKLWHVTTTGSVKSVSERRAGWYHSPAISPNGARLAVNVRTSESNVWILNRTALPSIPSETQ
jgi:eukaryotic-like serine/threonine-protein kinase